MHVPEAILQAVRACDYDDWVPAVTSTSPWPGKGETGAMITAV